MTAPEPAGPALRVSGLTVSFGETRVLEDVALELVRGEVLAVVGGSGSGKSTLVLALAGLLPKTARVAADAGFRPVRGAAAGVVFQEPEASFDPLFTIGDQISEVLACGTRLPARARKDRVRALLDRVGLRPPDRFARARPHQLSGGENQRGAFAAALALEPPILLLDEPTSALDADVEDRILELVRDLTQRSSLATLLVTHDFDVVAEIADKVAVLSRGRVVEQGPVRQILEAPREAATRELLAARLTG